MNDHVSSIAERFAKSHNVSGADYIGAGSFREVFTHEECPGVVFKRLRKWTEDELVNPTAPNQSEWEAFHKASESQRRILADVLYISKDGRVIVMEQLEALSKYDGPLPRHDLLMALKDALHENGLSTMTWDLCSSNAGVTADGQVKMIDYQDWDSCEEF